MTLPSNDRDMSIEPHPLSWTRRLRGKFPQTQCFVRAAGNGGLPVRRNGDTSNGVRMSLKIADFTTGADVP